MASIISEELSNEMSRACFFLSGTKRVEVGCYHSNDLNIYLKMLCLPYTDLSNHTVLKMAKAQTHEGTILSTNI